MAKQVVALERVAATYLRAALDPPSARPDGAENAENAPPKSERPRVLRGVAPPKPAPSAAHFATDLFGGAEKPSEPQLEADPFLREFRESVAALDAEAARRRAESRATGERAAGPGAVPFVPAGITTLSPSKSREPSRAGRLPARARPRARAGAARGAHARWRGPARARMKLSTLAAQLPRARARARRRSARETRPSSASRADGEVVAGANPSPTPSPGSWSMESESGLISLFQSARAFEEELEGRGGAAIAR